MPIRTYEHYWDLLVSCMKRFFPRPLYRFLATLKQGALNQNCKKRGSIIIEKEKLIYVIIPKAANSSIRNVLLGPAGFQDIVLNDPKDIHRLDRSYCNNYDLKRFPDYFSFSIVRNPLSRLVSCYKNKFLEFEKWDNKFYFRNYLFGYFKEKDSFTSFIDKVCKIPDRFADLHFISQHYLLTDKRGILAVDHIGKMEELPDSFDVVQQKFDLIDLPVINKTSVTNYKDYFTLEDLEKVYKRYKKDFHELGYYEEYNALRKGLT